MAVQETDAEGGFEVLLEDEGLEDVVDEFEAFLGLEGVFGVVEVGQGVEMVNAVGLEDFPSGFHGE